jgi:hypothetical protein
MVASSKLPDAFIRHGSTSVLADPTVQSAISQGRFQSTASSPVPLGPELLRTYRRRARHLNQFATPHAVRLREDVLAFCAALEKTPPDCPISCCSLDLDDGRSIVLFERADTNALLGVLRTVDQRMVSEEDWAALWGTPDVG